MGVQTCVDNGILLRGKITRLRSVMDAITTALIGGVFWFRWTDECESKVLVKRDKS